MPVIRHLIEDGHILYTKLVDPWTVAETMEIVNQQNVFAESNGANVHLLADLSETSRFPLNTLQLRETPAFSNRRNSKTVVVGANAIGHRIFEMFEQMRGIKAEYFDTYDEGLAYLRTVIAVESSELAPTKAPAAELSASELPKPAAAESLVTAPPKPAAADQAQPSDQQAPSGQSGDGSPA